MKIKSSITFSELLLVAFIVLKLCGVISWPWLWVLAPFWIPCAVAAGFLAVVGILWLIAYFLAK